MIQKAHVQNISLLNVIKRQQNEINQAMYNSMNMVVSAFDTSILTRYVHFLAGVVVGSATTWYLCAKKQENLHLNVDTARNIPMEFDEAINRLENDSKIDLILSASDNAARVLESLLSSQI